MSVLGGFCVLSRVPLYIGVDEGEGCGPGGFCMLGRVPRYIGVEELHSGFCQNVWSWPLCSSLREGTAVNW